MTKFRLFAGTNIGLRENNEDNFTVNCDLTRNEWVVPSNQEEIIQLGERGCLAVIADGMGGQNAGEIASATAIETVQELFSPKVMPSNVVEKSERILSYIKKVIIQADLRIKKRGANDSSVQGMGTTIVIVWLIGNKAYVGWMGDSRAYSFIPNKGISRITKDHSFVQQLIDANVMSEEQAMNDPNSNIVTRSLGDASQKAKPDVLCHSVTQGEIILLCTDGLCGVCNDKDIENILSQESNGIYSCKDKLTESALAAGGSDNITIALLQIVEADNKGKVNEIGYKGMLNLKKYLSIKNLLLVLLIIILIIISYFVGAYKSSYNVVNDDILVNTDSVKSEKPDTFKFVDKSSSQDNKSCLDNTQKLETDFKGGNPKTVSERSTEPAISENQSEHSAEPTISNESKPITTESKK